MSLITMLTKDQVDRLDQPVGRATGLAAELYTSPQFFEYEQRYLFAREWIFAAAVDELQEPGTAIPLTIAGRPILLVSDAQGAIRAFHNVCSHRGTVLVTEKCNVRGSMQCPYHAWSYGLDGELRAAPNVAGYGKHWHPGLDRTKHGLKPVRCETWSRLVFVNLSDAGPSLAEHMAPLTKRWPVDHSILRLGGTSSFEFKANWKLVMENFLESYHLPLVHPGLNSYSRMEDHHNLFIGPSAYGQGTKNYSPKPVDGKTLPTFPEVPPHLDGCGEYPILFPTLMLGMQATEFFAVRVDPVSPELTRETFYLFYPEAGLAEEYAAPRAASLKGWFTINEEDIGIVERMQQGRRSPAMDGGLFAPELEACLHAFQMQVATKILEGERAAAAR